jgi:hypothetical protein
MIKLKENPYGKFTYPEHDVWALCQQSTLKAVVVEFAKILGDDISTPERLDQLLELRDELKRLSTPQPPAIDENGRER